MKKSGLIKTFLVFFAFAVAVSSCTKDNTPEYGHFVSKELKLSYTATTITGFLNLAGTTYPGIALLKTYIKYDINVYKLVYKTTVGGNEIEASGLVCTPVTSGEYPVLSFQNGTNTVNAYAPSEYLTNPSYQMIQFVSSMGFIVVIPDYPGFGKSSTIPHPYLIKEPTVMSVVDMLRAVKEAEGKEFEGISVAGKTFLLGYSQGGWATLALHKALEQDYSSEFSLAGSVCGAGPYDMSKMFLGMINTTSYPMPSYICYIINAYSAYHQFTNPVSDILNEPYASKLSSLFNGTLSTDQINGQLTTSVPGLLKQDFLSGFTSGTNYSSVRDALRNNSITAWNTSKPLFFIHSAGDTQVPVSTTLNMYDAMIAAGTSGSVCKKLILDDLDHGDAVVPAMIEGLKFLEELLNQN